MSFNNNSVSSKSDSRLHLFNQWIQDEITLAILSCVFCIACSSFALKTMPKYTVGKNSIFILVHADSHVYKDCFHFEYHWLSQNCLCLMRFRETELTCERAFSTYLKSQSAHACLLACSKCTSQKFLRNGLVLRKALQIVFRYIFSHDSGKKK